MPRPRVQHVIQRARERYDLDLTGEDLHGIHAAIRAGDIRSEIVVVQPPPRQAGSRGARRQQEIRRIWLPPHPQPFLVVWDGYRIVTFLPPDAFQIRRIA